MNCRFSGIFLPMLFSISILGQSNWELDSSFADYGHARMDLDELDDFSGILYDDNGNAYFYGAAGNYTTFIDYDFIIGKLTSEGTLDSSFATNGLYRGDFYDQTSSHVVDAFYKNGYITFLAQSQTPSSLDTSFIAISRIDTLGFVDSTFGINGVFGGLSMGLKTQPNSLEPLSDGRILFTGTTFDSGYVHREIALVGRLTANGLPDSAFGGTGFLTWDYFVGMEPALFYIPDLWEKHDLGSSFTCAVENPWGDYLLGGYFDVGSYTRCLTIRVDTSGAMVTSFGSGGYFSFDHIPDNNNYVIDMKPYQGNVLVHANENAQTNFILTTITETAAVSAWTDIDIIGNKDVGTAIYIDSLDNIYLTGYTKNPSLTGPGYSSEYFTVTRLTNTFVVDTTFADNGFFFYDFLTGDEHGCSDFAFSNDHMILGGYFNNLTTGNYVDFGFVRLKSVTDTTLSISDPQEPITVRTFPNPAEDLVSIDFRGFDPLTGSIEVYNLQGAIVFQSTLNAFTGIYSLNLETLTSGMYLLRCQTNQGMFNSKITKK